MIMRTMGMRTATRTRVTTTEGMAMRMFPPTLGVLLPWA